MDIAQEFVAAAQRQVPVGEAAAAGSPEPERRTAADAIGSLLQRVTASSMDEIDRLIDEMTTMRHLLQTEAARVKCEIIIYAHLSQSAMRAAKSISENLAGQRIGRDEVESLLADDERCRAATGLRPDGDAAPPARANEGPAAAGLRPGEQAAQNEPRATD